MIETSLLNLTCGLVVLWPPCRRTHWCLCMWVQNAGSSLPLCLCLSFDLLLSFSGTVSSASSALHVLNLFDIFFPSNPFDFTYSLEYFPSRFSCLFVFLSL